MKKAFYSLTFVFLLLPFASTASEVQDNPTTSTAPLCAAQVKNGIAAFYFPITDNQEWVWYRNTTADNLLEYSWEVIIGSPWSAYEFGYYLYKFPGRLQKKGSLDELLQDAQISVMVSMSKPGGGTSASSRDDLIVRGGIINQWLIVTFKDNYTFNAILKDKPKTAQFVVRHPDKSKSYICNAPIKYIETKTQDKTNPM